MTGAGAGVQGYIEATEPPFSLIGVSDLVPCEMQQSYIEAGGDA